MRHAIIAECLDAAVAAPSIHNTQPWRFLLREHCIDVYADRSRQLAVIDPDGRELTISVGAAVLNLRVALLARGYKPLYALLPDPAQPDLMARVTIGDRTQPTYLARRLAGAIPRRHSNCRPFRSAELPETVLDELGEAAASEGGYLMIADPPLRDGVLGVVRRAETLRRTDPDYLVELAGWTAPEPGRREGVPLVAYAPPDRAERIPLRDFGLAHPARHAWPGVFEDEPTVAILYGSGDSPYAWLRAGQALERVLLTATANGAQSTLMTQPLEYADLRALFDDSAQGRVAQAVIRLGYGHESPPSPRRALADVLMSVPDEAY
ncbi:MAG: nitroreductase [Hamadaea sp.]|nr:nitroreductase [Hamadaea sp.]